MKSVWRSAKKCRPVFVLLSLGGMLLGCATFHNQWATIPVPIQANLESVPLSNGSGPNTSAQGETAAGGAVLMPAGDYQLLTLRPAPTTTSTPVLCTEPSPDFATALGSAIGATASGSAPSGPTASISANESSTEAITAMLGRTAGVVALRDGLYAACQAYANGVIGKDAYALIISQYGNLLVALASGSATGAPPAMSSSAAGASTAPAAAPTGIAVAVTAGPATTTPSTSARPGSNGGASVAGASASGVSSQVAIMQQENIQALLVACITDQDPTRSDNPVAGTAAIPGANDTMGYQTILTGRNPLLAQYCGQLMSAVVGQVPALLSPPPASGGK